MKHRNTGSISHTNTGYKNHTDTYGNHIDKYTQGYEQYLNHKDAYYNYANYSNYSYGEYSAGGGGGFRNIPKEIINSGIFSIQSRGHSNYGQNVYSQNSYNQSGQKHTNTGYTNHSNIGYTNHIDINENVEPSAISSIKDWTSAYYKDSLNIIWEKATDNNKCISVISTSYNDSNKNSAGIFENNIKKVSLHRGITIAYWNSLGIYQGYINKDTYGNINTLNELKNYYNNIPNNSFVILGSFDSIGTDNNIATIKNWLKSLGLNSADSLEGMRSVFAYIIKKCSGILDQQSHRYGLNPISEGCCTSKYIIPNVSSNQTITYILEYAFKGVRNNSYGSWTRIGTTTSTSYSYSLANHTNGFIKFRILANDGIENSQQWKESKEIRVLKYQKPNITLSEKIEAIDVKTIDLEIEKINTAIGTNNNNLNIVYDKIIPKSDIVSLRNKINHINRTLALGELGDKNIDTIYKADIENIKKNIEKI